MAANKGREFGIFLRNARLKCGYSQNFVSSQLGYTTAQLVSNFERGICYPPVKAYKKIIRLYKIKPKEFVERLLRSKANSMRKFLKSTKGRR